MRRTVSLVKIGRLSSRELVIQLLKVYQYCCIVLKPVKCLMLTLNPLTLQWQKTTDIEIVKYYQDQFGFKLPSELNANCTEKFCSLEDFAQSSIA